MEIKEYLRILSRYWWVIVVLAVIGGAIGWATWQFGTREYQSTSTLFVATQNGTTVTEPIRTTCSPPTGPTPTRAWQPVSRWQPGRPIN